MSAVAANGLERKVVAVEAEGLLDFVSNGVEPKEEYEIARTANGVAQRIVSMRSDRTDDALVRLRG